jgi:predicted component of type VI protein secretion system
MKMSLMVLSEGKSYGHTIPITLSQFIIGRDPQCQLRPASALISKRHCALIARGGKFFVRDFDSTNGTFVNEESVKGEREVKNEDTLKVGPLAFRVIVEGASVPVNKPTPLPKVVTESGGDDESVAAMLLDIADESKSPPAGEELPTGTTTMEMIAPALSDTAESAAKTDATTDAKAESKMDAAGRAVKAPEKKKEGSGDTSAAAQAILQKYMRRQRS